MASDRLIAKGVARREAIVTFIADYTKKHRYAPSIREIADGVGLASANAVHHHLALLAQEGRLKQQPGLRRTIVLTRRRRSS